jgi:hypothetical protein
MNHEVTLALTKSGRKITVSEAVLDAYLIKKIDTDARQLLIKREIILAKTQKNRKFGLMQTEVRLLDTKRQITNFAIIYSGLVFSLFAVLHFDVAGDKDARLVATLIGVYLGILLKFIPKHINFQFCKEFIGQYKTYKHDAQSYRKSYGSKLSDDMQASYGEFLHHTK